MSATTDEASTGVMQREVDAARYDLLAGLILAEFAGVSAGHCARVNYLDRREAQAICLVVRNQALRTGLGLDVWVLGSANDETGAIITSDRAIELRNRKLRPLCLFIPPDVIDSAASSLANSFATIDGRALQVDARKEALKQADDPLTTSAIQTVLRSLTGKARPADRNALDFILAGNLLSGRGAGTQLGRELWRVGLIADADPDFIDRLSRNRETTRKLARPTSSSSGLRERIADTRIDAATARRVQSLLAGHPLSSPQSWSEWLLDEGFTFDQWVFPEAIRADVSQVTVTPFRNRKGELERAYAKALSQPDGPGNNLFLSIRANEKTILPVKWTSDPVRTDDVAGWRVALLPLRDTEIGSTGLITSATSDTGDELDLPTKDVKGDKRDVRLTLTLDIDTEPGYEIVARVAAIDGTGAEIRNSDDEVVAGFSDPFFIRLADEPPGTGHSERRKTVASLAEGRLLAAIDAKTGVEAVEFSEPEWRSVGEISYFSLKTDPRTRVTVGLSSLLTELERDTLREPASLGRWALELDEVRAATRADIDAVPAGEATSDLWARFQSARKAFFEQLAPRPRKGASQEDANPRDLVEIAEWTGGQLGAVVRYAQAYRSLLDGLTEGGAPAAETRLALSVDTLSVRLAGRETEPAVMVLPTQPLRALWLASHHELLRHWQERALEISRPARRRELIDRDLIHDLRPVNVPAFAYGADGNEPFVFFRNLGFASGIALPAGVQDPVRRFLDLAQVLGFPDEPAGADDRAPERLKAHLERFADVHPYADPLQIALVNPDRGDLLAAALGQSRLFRGDHGDSGASGDDLPIRPVPLLAVSAYVLGGEDVTRTNLTRLRGTQGEAATRHPTDFLYPRLSTTVQPLSDLLGEDGTGPRDLAAAHLAVVADLCRPTVTIAPWDPEQDLQRGNSLYGLLTRFHGGRTDAVGGDAAPAFRWRYRASVPRAQRIEPHPVETRFGTALAEGQTAMLRATAAAIVPGERNGEPVIEVTLTPDLVRLLESLHDQTDWVVTIDRFFGIDYFDSPRDPVLASLAQKHVIDYSPEFVDGLGHRMIVTTAWRAEIESILRRAMNDSGFSGVDGSVRVLLGILKTVSGRLALQALNPTGASEAVGLAVTLLWLRAKGRLQNTVLIPVDVHQDVFTRVRQGDGSSARCDLLLIEFRSGFVNLSLVEVKNRRGPLGGVESLAEGMRGQLRATSEVVIGRFFNPDRVDAAMQRAVLGNIARFYVDRSERYGLVTPESGQTIRRAIAQYEKSGAEVRSERHDGVIVSLNDAGRPETVDGDFRVTVLTAAIVERFTGLADIAIEPGSGGEPGPGSLDDAADVSASDEAGTEPKMVASNGRVDANGTLPPTLPVSHPTGEHGESGNRGARIASANGTGRSEVSAITDASVATAPVPPATADPVEGVAPTVPVSVELGTGPHGAINWLPDVKGSPHLFITGIPGQGKSVTTRTLIADLARHGVPSLIFDFHGEYADDVRTWAPLTGVLSHPHLADAADGLPFSPFEVDPANAHQSSINNAQAIAEIFGYVGRLGDIQQDTLMTTIRDAYRAGGYADPWSESRVLPTMGAIRWRLERKEQESQVRNVLARCRPLLEFDLFRPDPDGLGFRELVREGLVVRLDRLMSEEVQTAAGAFLIRKVYRDMFRWGRPSRIQLAVVLDEAHRLALDATLPKLLKEGRKYGVLVIAASQGLSDFHKDVLGNVGTKIAFRSNHPDSRKVAGFFTASGSTNLPDQIERLGVGRAIVQTPEMRQAATVQMRA